MRKFTSSLKGDVCDKIPRLFSAAARDALSVGSPGLALNQTSCKQRRKPLCSAGRKATALIALARTATTESWNIIRKISTMILSQISSGSDFTTFSSSLGFKCLVGLGEENPSISSSSSSCSSPAPTKNSTSFAMCVRIGGGALSSKLMTMSSSLFHSAVSNSLSLLNTPPSALIASIFTGFASPVSPQITWKRSSMTAMSSVLLCLAGCCKRPRSLCDKLPRLSSSAEFSLSSETEI
mmetsp:Transcript_12265/g.28309  ORF Transcript_12265/g.28309 Transcript_12265/m.28309 type:complete len:238 (-) Transcript_12265:1675-2388(-)